MYKPANPKHVPDFCTPAATAMRDDGTKKAMMITTSLL